MRLLYDLLNDERFRRSAADIGAAKLDLERQVGAVEYEICPSRQFALDAPPSHLSRST